MKTIGLFEAKTHFSALADEVAENGRPVLVTRRGKPLVRIEAVATQEQTLTDLWKAYRKKYGEPGDGEQDLIIPPRRLERDRTPDFSGDV